MTKHSGQLFHIIEPLSCSLRHYLNKASEAASDVPDKVRFNFLKGKMISVVRGLDYLHDRGWVHFDLSLDSVGVSLIKERETMTAVNIHLKENLHNLCLNHEMSFLYMALSLWLMFNDVLNKWDDKISVA